MANFGVDLFFASQKQNIKNEADVLMIIVHWVLCKNEGLRNVGVGDNVKLKCKVCKIGK
jgi:hypothetical protein